MPKYTFYAQRTTHHSVDRWYEITAEGEDDEAAWEEAVNKLQSAPGEYETSQEGFDDREDDFDLTSYKLAEG